MKSLGAWAWYTGKLLQICGLATTGYALFVGLSTSDSKQEVTLLGLGAGEFMLGVLLLKSSGGGGSA